MAAYLMCESTPRESASFAALNRIQSMCRKASARNRANNAPRVFVGSRTLRVLVVDDEQERADDLAETVHDWGHSARSAYDGGAALRVAATQHPDVVLLKIDLPRVNGCQVARQLRLDFPRNECLIIAFSAVDDDRRRRECDEAGVDLLLFNPVDLAVVETLLILECELANRSPADDADGGASQREAPLALDSIA